ncbi:Avirulence (Avh) protein [Phytophthora megakarya]|uniref:RxLR effector protein n=1 Tax=Phytophthora megakarya TaxID=4795 RepID=A0A225UY16_9STRA|nr:Avirulence (Avh) protein [Phytophthora megakarya]
MRLSFILPVVMAVMYCVTCNAVAEFEQIKLSVERSLDERLNNNAGGRFLRAHHKHEDPNTEERGFISNLFTSDKKTTRNFLDELLADSTKARQAFAQWKADGKTLTDIDNLLKVAKVKGKYNQLYNDYAYYRGWVSAM